MARFTTVAHRLVVAAGLSGLLLAAAQAQVPAKPEMRESCPGLIASDRPPVIPAAYLRTALAEGQVRITYSGHSTFLLESAKLVRIATDYNDFLRPPATLLPDIVTMNHAHSTHYTDRPDPDIKFVLRGWRDDGKQADHDVSFGDVRVRSVSTNIRNWNGGTEYNGNSIFIFEMGKLCIAHLGHLHHTLTQQQLDDMGRIDILMVPVDGGLHHGHRGHDRGGAGDQGAADDTDAFLLDLHAAPVPRSRRPPIRRRIRRSAVDRGVEGDAAGEAEIPGAAGPLIPSLRRTPRFDRQDDWPMMKMPIVDLLARGRELAARGERVSVLWQEPELLAFVARGREYRSEFHINPSDEVMLAVKGEMRLHFRTPEGKEEVVVVPEGSTIYTPAGTPHSPRFAPDSYLLVIERRRRAGEVDRFQWFCPRCDAQLHEEAAEVLDYRSDPVSKAYARFFDSEDFRTCRACGHVMPRPGM